MNQLQRLKKVLGESREYVGEVTAYYGDGKYFVSLLGGGSVVATYSGSLNTGDKVFLKDTTITSVAPQLQLQQVFV